MSIYERLFPAVFTIVVFVVCLSISFAFAWLIATQEAKSYNKFCDTPVTTWDALWLDLRIDECN